MVIVCKVSGILLFALMDPQPDRIALPVGFELAVGSLAGWTSVLYWIDCASFSTARSWGPTELKNSTRTSIYSTSISIKL